MSETRPRRSIWPDLWVGGAAAAIGLGTAAHERDAHAGIVIGSITYVFLCYVYPLPAGLFDWPQGWITPVVASAVEMLDFINVVFTILS